MVLIFISTSAAFFVGGFLQKVPSFLKLVTETSIAITRDGLEPLGSINFIVRKIFKHYPHANENFTLFFMLIWLFIVVSDNGFLFHHA